MLAFLHKNNTCRIWKRGLVDVISDMRYLVKARVKPGSESALLRSLADGTLGRASIAGDEYRHDMQQARISAKGEAYWVETCFCDTPLDEERPYWEEFFELVRVQDAHARSRCRDLSGTEPWACGECDCTERLEAHLAGRGRPFVEVLRQAAG